jgi:sulfotransferase family protein
MPKPSPHKPDFFILGAGKSGTTSLYFYLAQHPEIFMSPVKEPSFFCDVFQVVNNPIHYLALFQGATTQKRIGEASHVYLSCPKTAPVLRALFPDARFVLILRNPVERAHSLYHHMIKHGCEWISSFEKALHAEETRAADPVFEKHNPQYFYNYLYFRSGLYGEQIERYFHWFDRDRFLFLTTDDLLSDPLGLIRRVWKFLGVDPSVVPNMEVMNQGGSVRSAPWQFFLHQRLRPALCRLRVPRCHHVVEWFMNRNSAGVPIPPMKPQTRELLRSGYAADLLLTEELTGLDLSAWKFPAASLAKADRAAA